MVVMPLAGTPDAPHSQEDPPSVVEIAKIPSWMLVFTPVLFIVAEMDQVVVPEEAIVIEAT